MRISISNPPIPGIKGTPTILQNRQFQVFSEPTYIYPVIPAYAATLLEKAGHEVVWDDGIAEEESYDQWLSGLSRSSPDVVLIETKTPVVKRHWRIIGDVKGVCPETKVVLVGDHVTALPRESMESSGVDFVIEGGDYDFLLLNLVGYLDGRTNILEPGIWYREDGEVKNTGHFALNHDLNSLPIIDRDLTRWRLYSEKNGNFKVTPGTYTMVGRDCWHRKNGGCSFCSWPTLYPTFRSRKPESLVGEVGVLIEKYGVREIMDDTGTFIIGEPLKRFCELMIARGYSDEVVLDCNMRFGALSVEDYRLMKRAGFRMLLFGVESASQKTLDRLNKGITVDDIVKGCRMASEAGLEPHITIMVGYPWETREDALGTLKLARWLMEEGWAFTLQSTIVMPYPGTKMFGEALENGWFRVDPRDYDRFDMVEPVLKTVDMEPQDVVRICDEIYKSFLSPKYVFRRLTRLRSWRDLSYSTKGVAKVLGHIKDFARR